MHISAVISWLILIQLLGLRLFFNGFLLTREELPFKSSCSGTLNLDDEIDLYQLYNASLSSNVGCPPDGETRFKKLVLIIIDALRFDYILNKSHNGSIPAYMNKLQSLHSIRTTTPHRAWLVQSRADPPTATTQRLKAIVTGSLPTYAEASSSFSAQASIEDHLVSQMSFHSPDKIWFMGDDTWTQLFPLELGKRASQSFPFESFKLFDLHTVDNGIKRHLFPLLNSSFLEYDYLVAHFLGVDHCGHKYGALHPAMAEKLIEMDQVLSTILENVDDDTVTVIMGDHGATDNGDHGGESLQEVLAGLMFISRPSRSATLSFASEISSKFPQYSKLFEEDAAWWRNFYNGFAVRRQAILQFDEWHPHPAHYPLYQFDSWPETDSDENFPVVPQIDLTSTLSYMLGLPIPFGNLGTIIPELVIAQERLKWFSLLTESTNHGYVASQIVSFRFINMRHLATVLRSNSLQIYRYLVVFSSFTSNRGFQTVQISYLLHLMADAENYRTKYLSFEGMQLMDQVSSNFGDMNLNHVKECVQKLEILISKYQSFMLHTLKHGHRMWTRYDLGAMILGIFVLILAIFCIAVFLIQHFAGLTFTLTANNVSFIFISAFVTICEAVLLFPWLHEGDLDRVSYLDVIGIFFANWSSVIFLFNLKISNWISMFDSSFWYCGGLWISYVIMFGGNSQIIFEDRVVQFFLVSVALGGLLVRRNQLKELLWPLTAIAVLARLSAWTGVCREEQYPYCAYVSPGTLSHRIHFLAATVLFFSVWIHTHDLRFWSRYLISGLTLALCCSWMITLNESASRNYSNSHADPNVIVNGTMIQHESLFSFDKMDSLQWFSTLFVPRLIYSGIAIIIMLCASSNVRIPWLHCIMLLLAALQRPFGGWSLLMFVIVFESCLRRIYNVLPNVFVSMLIFFGGFSLFFVTGHQAVVSSIQYEAAYHGFTEFYPIIAGLMVALNTIAGPLLMIVMIPFICNRSSRIVIGISGILILLSLTLTLFMAMVAFILRRHLMIWKIFTPRLLLQALLCGILDVVLLVFSLLVN